MRRSPCPPEAVAALLPPQGKILDIGCGDGGLLSFLSSRGEYALFGAEPEEGAAFSAKSACPAAEITRAPAEALPYPDGFFDAAVMECVFSLCQPERAVAELSRVLRPGGTAVIADLYARGSGVGELKSAALGSIYERARLEGFFAGAFEPTRFEERSEGLRQLLFELIMGDEPCSCVLSGDAPALRLAKPGYGIWVFKKIQIQAGNQPRPSL